MARKRRGSSHSGFTIPLAVVAGVAGGLAPTISVALATRDPTKTVSQLSRNFTGFNPATGQWNPQDLMGGLVPVLAGFFVHALASRIGVNRALGRAKIPIVRV